MHHPFLSMSNLFVNVEGLVCHKLYVDEARLLAREMKKALVVQYKIPKTKILNLEQYAQIPRMWRFEGAERKLVTPYFRAKLHILQPGKTEQVSSARYK